MGFRIAGFSGLVPRRAKQLLDVNQAQVATNCTLTSGDLRPRNGPLFVFAPEIDGDIVSMFRITKDTDEKWLAWTRDVDVARSPIAGNEERRFYYTGDGEPRVSNYALATAGPGPYPAGSYVLGVSPPLVAPSVSPTGGASATNVTRSYVYTFVTSWGEESAPSPAYLVTGKEDATAWNITGMAVPPVNSGTISAAIKDTPQTGQVQVTMNTVYGLRANEEITFAGILGMTDLNGTHTLYSVDAGTGLAIIELATSQTYTSGGTWSRVAPHNLTDMTKRIYRTLTTGEGTEFHYVATVSAATTSYSDSIAEADVALAGQLPSELWLMPPADLKGIIILPNGIAAGFTGNEIHFSEPFKPYAWPSAYRQAYDQDIVAIGVTGTTLVGMTEGNPFTITGVDPLTMGGGMEKLAVAWPCMSKRSVASFAFGVGYAAPQGLVIIGGTSDVVTKDLFTQKEWSDLNPDSFFAATADNRYYASYAADGSTLMFVIDKTEAASFTKINYGVTSIWTDPATGKLYVAKERKIYHWEGDAGTKLSYEWKSKQFISAPPVNYGAAKVDVDFTMTEDEIAAGQASYDDVVAANDALLAAGDLDDALADPALGEYEIGGDPLVDIPVLSIDSLIFQLYANGVLKHTKQVQSSRAFRLPGGYKADNLEIVLSGNVKVSGVVIAETMEGLKQA